MFETLVTVTIGVASAGLAWAVAWRSGAAGSPRHRAVLLVSFAVLFTLGSSTLLPPARAWKRERDVDILLASEPLFASVIADEPALRVPLRAGLLEAFRDGSSGDAVLAGQRLLSPRLWLYVPRASNAAALGLGRALVATLTRLRARDPEECYRFLFPAAAGRPRDTSSPADRDVLAALRDVVASARDGSAEPLDRRAAGKLVDDVFGRLRAQGQDVDVLRRAQAPDVDRARVCSVTIALYAGLTALAPDAAGQALRHTLGPEQRAPGR
jgi:hypothetical protein